MTSAFFGCNHLNDSVVVSPMLTRNLKLIIEKHDSLIESNPSLFDAHIYKVRFEKNQNECYIIIGTDVYYNSSLMDGYLLRNKNLIVFEKTLNNPCNNHVKIENQIKNEEELSLYSNENEGLSPYRSLWWVFKIEGDSLILYDQGGLKIDFNSQ